MAIDKHDIGLLFGVLGGGSINGESGQLIKSQLESIVSSLNTDAGAKQRRVKLSVDIQSTKAAFTQGLKQITEGLSGQKQFKLTVSNIDATAAIKDFRNQLEAMLKTLKIDTGFNVTVGSGGATEAIKEISNSAKQAVLSLTEVDSKLKEIAATNSFVSAEYRRLKQELGSEAATGESAQAVQALKEKYTELLLAVENVRANRNQATQEDIQNIYNLQGEMERLLTTQREIVNASKQDTSSGEKEREATLKQVIALYQQIDTYIKANPRIIGTVEHNELLGIQNQLNQIRSGAQDANGEIITMSKIRLGTLHGQFSKLRSELREAGNEGRTLVSVITAAYQKFGGWLIVTRSTSAIIRQLRQMVTNVNDIDKAMTELRRVTSETDAVYSAFLDNAAVRAKALGATLTETINASADFARLGFSIPEAEILADVALMYFNVGDGINTINDATRSIISTMKAFGIEAADAMSIVDKFNEVGNNFAITNAGIGDALQRSAAALASANNTLDESIGLIVAANNVIQNPEVVGTALKTVSMRLRNTAGELEALGEDADGAAESITKLQTQLLNLTQGRVNIMLDDDTFKSTYQIMVELSEIWDSLTDKAQADVVRLVAGVRQGNVIAAIMSNMSEGIQATEISLNSFGSAMQENEKFLNSIAGRIKIFNAAFEDLSRTLISDDLFKGVVDFGTGIVTTLTAIIDKLGALTTISMAVSGVLAAKGVGWVQLKDNIDGTGRSLSWFFQEWGKSNPTIDKYNSLLGKTVDVQGEFLQNVAFSDENLAAYLSSLNGSKASLQGYNAYCKAAGISVQSMGVKSKLAAVGVTALNVAMNMLITMGIGLVIQGIIAGLSALVNASANASRAARELADSTREKADAIREEVDELNKLIAKYEEVRKQDFVDAGTRTEVRNIQERITELVGEQARNLDLVNGRLDDQLNRLKEIALHEARRAQDALVAAYTTEREASNRARGDQSFLWVGGYEFVGSRDKEAERLWEQAGFDAMSSFTKGAMVASGGAFGSHLFISTMGDASERADALREMLDILREADGYDHSASRLFAALQTRYNEYTQYGNRLSLAARNLLDNATLIASIEADIQGISVDSIESYDEYRNAILSSIGANTSLAHAISNGSITVRDMEAAVDDLMATNFPEWYNRVNESFDENVLPGFIGRLSELKDTLSDLQSAYNLLSAAQNEMNETGGLSADTIQKLANATDNYLDFLYEENGVVRLNETAYKNWADSRIQNDLRVLESNKLRFESTKRALEQEQESLRRALQEAQRVVEEHNERVSVLGDNYIHFDTWLIARRDAREYSDALDDVSGRLQIVSDDLEGINKQLDMQRAIFNSLQSIDLSNVTNGLDAFKLATDGINSIISAIDNYASKMSTIVDIQDALAESFVITLEQARNFAAIYPEILNGATATADGQILLNEEVAKSFAERARAELNTEIDMQIAKLEAVKVHLEAKRSSAEAQLELANAVAEGEIEIENAKVQLLADAEQVLAQYLYDLGLGIVEANKAAAEAKAGNMEEYARIVEGVADDNANNLARSMVTAANSTRDNVVAMVDSLDSLGRQAANVASQIARIGDGVTTYHGRVTVGGGGRDGAGFTSQRGDRNFIGIDPSDVNALSASLGEWKRVIELDIAGYTQAIAQIDGQIAALEALRNLPTHQFRGGLGGRGGSAGGSGGSGSTAEAIQKEIEEYIAMINELYAAEERLKDIQERRAFVEAHIDTSGNTIRHIEYMKEIISLYQQEQDALHQINQLRRRQINDNVERLRDQGFVIDWNAESNHLFIRNLEQINNLQSDTMEETNELRKAYEDLISSTISLNEANRANSLSWWDVQRAILDTRTAIYDQWLATKQFDVAMKERIGADPHDIVRSWRVVLDGINAEIKYWTDLGYDYASDKIKQLTQDLWNTEDAIRNALESIVTAANSALDNIQNVYSTLRGAAQEFAESGFITVDTFQRIASLGVEYLAYLQDENGQLVINEQAIHNVIAAKTQQMAVETALNYVRALGVALDAENVEELARLLNATEAATNSTWDLVYANLALLDLDGDQFAAAASRIDALRALADTAVTSIGQISGALSDSLREQERALDDLLKYVMDMIRWEVRTQIDGLREQVTQYRNIVNLQKESLRVARDRENHERNVARRIRDIAALQSRIDQLALDDSREAQAERRKLEEQLYDLQEGLADLQADHAYNTHVSTLDKMADEFEKSKNEEIRILENTISSYQKLYDMAIRRISEQWDTLYQDLIHWNYEAGNTIESEIAAAWDTASIAVQRYGSYLNAILQTQSQIAAMSGGGGGGFVGSSGGSPSSPTVVGNSNNNRPSQEDMRQAVIGEIQRLVSYHRSLGAQWAAANARGDNAEARRLADLGKQLEPEYARLFGRPIVRNDSAGTWHVDRVGGADFFDELNRVGIEGLMLRRFHTGTMSVGGSPSLKDNEVVAVLEKKEAVLTEPQKEGLYKIVDFASVLSERLGSAIDTSKLGSMPLPTGHLLPSISSLQRIGDAAGGFTFSPEINVTVQHDGALDEESARRVGRGIGDGAIERLNEAAGRRGMGTLTGSTLRN
jgi:TP901 family phage tail tape measure protein